MSKEAALSALSPGITAQPTQTPAQTDSSPAGTQATIPDTKKLDSDRFAALAKKESEFVKRQQEVKKMREDADSVLSRARQFEDMKKSDPVAALKMIGFSETDIFNFMAAQEKVELSPEEKAAKAGEDAATAKIKEFQDSQEKVRLEELEKRDTRVLSEFKSGISKAITSNKEKYEYCAHYGEAAEALVYETVLKIVEDSKGADVPSIEDVIADVESYYEEEDKALMSLKKRQPKVDAEAPAPGKPMERTRTVTNIKGEAVDAPKTKTLHNGASATVASTVAPRGKETHQQKKERLIQALLNGTNPTKH